MGHKYKVPQLQIIGFMALLCPFLTKRQPKKSQRLNGIKCFPLYEFLIFLKNQLISDQESSQFFLNPEILTFRGRQTKKVWDVKPPFFTYHKSILWCGWDLNPRPKQKSLRESNTLPLSHHCNLFIRRFLIKRILK